MADRKIIFKCRTGSHLYGTNRPESDEDFQGVFLPSTADVLSLDKCPDEWTEDVKVSSGPRNSAGDVDWFDILNEKIDNLRQKVEPVSALPDQPNWKQLNKLCTEMLRRHIL